MKKRNIIIDTDPGHDDALAIMLADKSGLFDIKALTTVAGNSTIENVTKNAFYILDLLQSNDIPVYSGKAKPLKRPLIQAVVHGKSGLAGANTANTKFALTNNAEDKIIEIVKQYKNNITLLTLGPLSNIARSFLKTPELPTLINEIVMMGGAINVEGNKSRVAEFNIFVDPEAADIVFKTNTKKVLIPIDICNSMSLSLEDFEELKNTDLYKPIMSMMKHFIKGIESDEGVKGALVYDAVAAYYLINPSAFKLEKMDIVIETKGEYTSGMTVAEKRNSSKKEYNVNVAISLDKETFKKDFITLLNK
ncbi:MAG: nucleoside hydrolase [Candidatus Levybacteria bacterium]|nr:nucleoside hydrolase [Candidatus Levybacteria bacterium]